MLYQNGSTPSYVEEYVQPVVQECSTAVYRIGVFSTITSVPIVVALRLQRRYFHEVSKMHALSAKCRLYEETEKWELAAQLQEKVSVVVGCPCRPSPETPLTLGVLAV